MRNNFPTYLSHRNRNFLRFESLKIQFLKSRARFVFTNLEIKWFEIGFYLPRETVEIRAARVRILLETLTSIFPSRSFRRNEAGNQGEREEEKR